MDALLHRRVLTRAALAGYLDAHPGWPGNAQLCEVLALAEPLSESPMETRLRLIVHDADLPSPAVQHEVRTPDGTGTSTGNRRFIARVDLAYPDWRIANG